MDKYYNFLRFYYLATSLKYRIRQGMIYWKVEAERIESVAEHIYDTCILAISIHSEFNVDVNLDTVIKMLVIHELEEIVIGDITPFDNVTDEEKLERGRKAVKSILSGFTKEDEYFSLTNEFNDKKTKEGKFAYYCDKLDFDLQMKLYDDAKAINFEKIKDSPVYNDKRVQDMLSRGAKRASDMFYEYGRSHFEDSQLFTDIMDYIYSHDLKEFNDNIFKELNEKEEK